jgi:hypothetical protein
MGAKHNKFLMKINKFYNILEAIKWLLAKICAHDVVDGKLTYHCTI